MWQGLVSGEARSGGGGVRVGEQRRAVPGYSGGWGADGTRLVTEVP